MYSDNSIIMKNKFLYLITALLLTATSFAQVTNKIQADSVRIFQVGGHPAEVIIENGTKSKTGAVLKNTGNGRTQFDYVIDTLYVQDSLLYVKRGPVTSSYNLKAAVPNDGVGSFNSRYSITKGTGDSAQLVNDTVPGNNTTPLAYQILNGRRGYYPVKADTADIFGIDSSLSFNNIADLRSTQLYNKGARVATTMGYTSRNDGGGSLYSWNASSTATDDGKFVFKPNAISSGPGRWEWMAKGKVRAAEVGVKSDGTDQTSTLNTLLSLSTVKKVIFDNGPITVNSTFNAKGKQLEFDNGAMIIGSGKVRNANIIADDRVQIFDTTVTIEEPRNTYFSIMWTGCKMDSYTSLGTNNYTPFMKALGATTTSGNTVWQRCILYVPGATDTTYYGYHYGFGRTIKIDKQVTILGDNNRTSVLVFPGDSIGITMQVTSQKSVLKHLGIWGRYAYSDPSNGYNNPNSAGLLVQSNGGYYEDLWINGFNGDGIANVGDVNQSTNSNNNHYIRCYITYNGRHGMFFAGGDANQCTVDHCDIVGNARHSIYEASFLGNLFIGVHSASNGSIHPKSRSTVRHGGVSYWVTAPNKNIEPGVTSGWQNYWQVTSGFYDPSETQYQWNATDSFFVGGSFLAEGANQRGSLYECYAEDDEMKVFPGQTGTGTTTLFGFAEGYIKMTAGGNNGFKADGWQSIDPSENIEVDHYGKGYRSFMFYDVDNNQAIGLSYYKVRKVMTVMSVNDNGASSATWFASDQFPASLLGLSTTPRGSTLFNGKSFWKKEDGYYNSVSIQNVVPTTGEYSAGDFIFNGGSDTTILGWAVRTSGSFSGTPPVIVTIKNPNMGGSGSGETNTASNLGGGLANYSTKSGVDLRFNSFDATDFDLSSNLISLDATLKSAWNAKQDALVSATNIKTVNGNSLLGSGNLSIAGANPAGNYNNIQINRNGLFDTPGGDSLTWTTGGIKSVLGFKNAGDGRLYDNVGGATNLQIESGVLQVFPTSGDPSFYLYNAAFSKSLALRILGNDGYIAPPSGGVLRHAGLQKDDAYGTGTNTGTLTYLSGYDASGNVIEVDPATVGSSSGGVQTLNVQYTDVSNSGSTETNLMSYTIPASQLTNVGDRIVIEGMFTTPSGNSNSKNLKWYFGSTTQIWDASTIATGTSVHVRITIIRTGTGTQKLVQEFHTGFTSIESYTTSGQDETATISMRFASIGTATNDITQRTMTVTYYPYTP